FRKPATKGGLRYAQKLRSLAQRARFRDCTADLIRIDVGAWTSDMDTASLRSSHAGLRPGDQLFTLALRDPAKDRDEELGHQGVRAVEPGFAMALEGHARRLQPIQDPDQRHHAVARQAVKRPDEKSIHLPAMRGV